MQFKHGAVLLFALYVGSQLRTLGSASWERSENQEHDNLDDDDQERVSSGDTTTDPEQQHCYWQTSGSSLPWKLLSRCLLQALLLHNSTRSPLAATSSAATVTVSVPTNLLQRQSAASDASSSQQQLPDWLYHSDKIRLVDSGETFQWGKAANATTIAEPARSIRLSDHVVLYLNDCSADLPSMNELLNVVPLYSDDLTVVYPQTCANASTTWRNALHGIFPWSRIRESRPSRIELTDPGITLLLCLNSSALECVVPALLRPLSYSIIVGHVSPALVKSSTVIPDSVQVIPSERITSKRACSGTMRYHPSGNWKTNESMGIEYSYKDNLWIKKEQVERLKPHDLYQWYPVDSSCGTIPRTTRQGFCSALHALNMRRVLVLGDSLQYMALLSTMYFLGFASNEIEFRKHLFRKNRFRVEQIVECPNAPDISVTFYRVNHLMPLKVPGDALAGRDHIADRFGRRFKRSAKEYFSCYSVTDPFPSDGETCPWVKEYLSTSEPTLLWVGLGAHFHHVDAFEESMNSFMDLLYNQSKAQDLIYFRTQNIGHESCLTESRDKEFPYPSFASYQSAEGSAKTFDWNLFKRHNKYMEQMVWRNNRFMKKQKHVPFMGLHDIYWMTALRRDSHVSPNDCLHYILPGPSDWWSNMLLADLRELSEDNRTMTRGRF